jgi:uncharacterized protein YhfF
MKVKDNEVKVHELSKAYFNKIKQPARQLNAWYFCDNEKDANECAELVLAGIKRATATSIYAFELNQEPLPRLGDLNIITDWNGKPQCIIKTTQIDIIPFSNVSAEFAAIEGEGDKSLAYWRNVHWAYYNRELQSTQYQASEDMLIVCEQFEVVYKH